MCRSQEFLGPALESGCPLLASSQRESDLHLATPGFVHSSGEFLATVGGCGVRRSRARCLREFAIRCDECDLVLGQTLEHRGEFGLEAVRLVAGRAQSGAERTQLIGDGCHGGV